MAIPTFRAAGADPDELSLKRDELDDWLDAPMGREAEAHAALLNYLKGA